MRTIRAEDVNYKGLTREENRDACKTLDNLAASLGSIRSQTTFKRVALLGGIEKTLKAMEEEIWQAIKHLSTLVDGCRMS